jgi:hypothetical protein
MRSALPLAVLALFLTPSCDHASRSTKIVDGAVSAGDGASMSTDGTSGADTTAVVDAAGHSEDGSAGQSSDARTDRDAAPSIDVGATPSPDGGGLPDATTSPADAGVPTTGPCAGVTCSGHGVCMVQFVLQQPTCNCDPGYLAYGLGCTLERRLACRNADGSIATRGSTRCSQDDMSIEVCHDADGDRLVEWTHGVDCANGMLCSQGCLGAPCPGQPCPIGTSCVESAHGQPLGVCVAICDCQNCGNCGPDNSAGQWNDEQQYCGNGTSSPATAACALPCPNAGDGCIPYSPSICWPIEGCFSATP